jgi:hypothetical protein
MKTRQVFNVYYISLSLSLSAFCSYKYYNILKNSYDCKIIGYETKLRPMIGLFLLHFTELISLLFSGARKIYICYGTK